MGSKNWILTLIFSSLLVFVHCDGCFKSCDSGPFFADLEIKLTVNDENTQVPIEVYEGMYDTGSLIIQDTISAAALINGKAIYNLEAGIFYSAAAIYKSGAKTIIAIDGAEMQLSTDDCNCDYPSNRILNLRLAK
ncbi:MAG: hypothetical protein ACFHWX_21915 [Bacteroidota bacterium]